MCWRTRFRCKCGHLLEGSPEATRCKKAAIANSDCWWHDWAEIEKKLDQLCLHCAQGETRSMTSSQRRAGKAIAARSADEMDVEPMEQSPSGPRLSPVWEDSMRDLVLPELPVSGLSHLPPLTELPVTPRRSDRLSGKTRKDPSPEPGPSARRLDLRQLSEVPEHDFEEGVGLVPLQHLPEQEVEGERGQKRKEAPAPKYKGKGKARRI